jgi:glycolate oxidase
MDDALRARLREAVGATGLSRDDVVMPASVEQVVAVLRACADASTRVTVTSGDAGTSTGRRAAARTAEARDSDRTRGAPSGERILLSLNRLQRLNVEPQRLIARAESGVSIASLRAETAAVRLAVVGMPGSVTSEHIGSLIARGEVSRRALCGVEAVLTTGEMVSFGGGVLKDVVGFDIPTLLLGSMGRLAVIVAVTFRLEPEGAKTPVATAPGAQRDGAEPLFARAFDPQGLLQPAQ